VDDKDCESLRRAVGAGDVEFFADWALGQPVVSKIPLVRNFRVLYDSTKFRKKMLLSRILSFVSRIFNNCDDLLNRSMVSASGSSLLLFQGTYYLPGTYSQMCGLQAHPPADSRRGHNAR